MGTSAVLTEQRTAGDKFGNEEEIAHVQGLLPRQVESPAAEHANLFHPAGEFGNLSKGTVQSLLVSNDPDAVPHQPAKFLTERKWRFVGAAFQELIAGRLRLFDLFARKLAVLSFLDPLRHGV